MLQKQRRTFLVQVQWKGILVRLLIVLAFINVWAVMRVRGRLSFHDIENITTPSPPSLKRNKPIFVVGFPKTGTTSIHSMFSCAGLKSSHYCCCGSPFTHTDCKGGRTISACIRDNRKRGRPILEGCGEYDVYAQMDAEVGRSIHLPQHSDLDLLHAYAPHATFLLNLRPAEEWRKSVTSWYGLGGRFLTLYKIDVKKVNRTQALIEIYDNHTSSIREFVRRHPSHALVEVDISNVSAGMVLSEAFGIPSTCWGWHNPNKKRNSG